MINSYQQIAQGYQLINNALTGKDLEAESIKAKALIRQVPMGSVVYFLAKIALDSVELQQTIVKRSFGELKNEDMCGGLRAQLKGLISSKIPFRTDNEQTRLDAYTLHEDAWSIHKRHKDMADKKMMKVVPNGFY